MTFVVSSGSAGGVFVVTVVTAVVPSVVSPDPSPDSTMTSSSMMSARGLPTNMRYSPSSPWRLWRSAEKVSTSTWSTIIQYWTGLDSGSYCQISITYSAQSQLTNNKRLEVEIFLGQPMDVWNEIAVGRRATSEVILYLKMASQYQPRKIIARP